MSKMPISRPFDVLLVEDNEDDVWLTRRAFRRLSESVRMHVARNGVEALTFLRKLPPYTDAAHPDLLLIDLNMPRMDGRELLAELKQDDRLMLIPAIILSTSVNERDVRDSYRGHAAAYIAKPLCLDEFAHRMRALVDFWLGEVAILPSFCSDQHQVSGHV